MTNGRRAADRRRERGGGGDFYDDELGTTPGAAPASPHNDYVEVDDESGVVSYVEHHRTLGDWVRLLAARGFVLADLVEPEWPVDHDRVWGGWSRTRGLLTPGTAIFVADLSAPQ